MVLSIATTHTPATDLGFLLAKNPANVHVRAATFGRITAFFSEASTERCEAVLLVEIDPIKLIRSESSSLDEYVSPAPYALTSFVSVALREMFSTAMSGRSKERPELTDQPIPLEIRLPGLPARGWGDVLPELFEPLGWQVEARPIPLDEKFPEWGASAYFDVTLRGEQTVQNTLQQLYVLLPVLDDRKHYFIDRKEIEKLQRAAGDWLPNHPKKAWIIRRYLRKAEFIRDALARLLHDEEPTLEEPEIEEESPEGTEAESKPVQLHKLRLQTAADRLEALGCESVLDLGCGEGKLVRMLAAKPGIKRIVGMDVSFREIRYGLRRLERAPAHIQKKIQLLHGSLTYRDARLRGFDGAALVEVVEHLDPERLTALERSVFGDARPRVVVVTTPNKEYNATYGMEQDSLRHEDHRFEWTRAEFRQWAEQVASAHGYGVAIEPVGPLDETHGAPSQMGVFTLAN